MLKVSKSSILLLLPILFILSASLLGTISPDIEGRITRLYSLPPIIDTIAYSLYLFLIIVFIFIGIIKTGKDWKLHSPILILILSYSILFLWSMITFSDQVRYFIIFLSVAFGPIGIAYILERIKLNVFAISLVSILSFILFLSVILSFLNFSLFPRVSGIYGNPNLMGVSLVSITALIFYFEKYINKRVLFVIASVALALVLLSGSRLAFITFSLVLIPYFSRFKFISFFIFSFLAIFFLVVLYYVYGSLEFNFRAFEVGSAVSDSGRSVIWERAIECINSEPLTGHGMLGAQNCVNIGNVHNSYLRVSVMLGIPLTVIFFTLFLMFLIKALMMPVSPFIKLYFLGLSLAFFSEDYIVGFASPFFPFFIFMLALFIFDLKNNKNLIKGVSEN